MRVLIPVDGSRDSREALKFLATRKSLLATNPLVELLYVQKPLDEHSSELGEFDMGAYYEERSRQIFDDMADEVASLLIPVKKTSLVGQPASSIPEYAYEIKPDLILMGARGMSTVRNLYMGSVSLSVASEVKCPVLICRKSAYIGEESLSVGVAVDGSDFGPKCADFMLAHAELFGPAPKISVVGVVSDIQRIMPAQETQETINDKLSMASDITMKRYEAIAAETLAKFAQKGREVEKVPLVGDAEIELLDWSHKHADMVVMGTHGRGALKSLVFGSCTRALLASSDLPILIIPRV